MDIIEELHPHPVKATNMPWLLFVCSHVILFVPLYTKTAEEVIQAYIDNVYAKFSSSFKILSDNGTEFKNKLFEQIAKELGVKSKKYTALYHPASNR